MIKIFFILCLFIISCTTTPVKQKDAVDVPSNRLYAYQKKTTETTSTIIAIRDSGYQGGGCYCGFYINGILAARIDTSEIAKFYIEPGETLLKLGQDPYGKGLCGIFQEHFVQRETVLKPNETKTFNLRLLANGVIDIQRAE